MFLCKRLAPVTHTRNNPMGDMNAPAEARAVYHATPPNCCFGTTVTVCLPRDGDLHQEPQQWVIELPALPPPAIEKA